MRSARTRQVRFDLFGFMVHRFVFTAIVVCACAGDALGHHFRFTTFLSGPAESPPNISTGSGHVVLTLDVDEGTMEVETTFADLIGTATEAHIHASTATVGSGTADPATQLPSLADFPTSVAQGDYEHEFNLLEADTYNPAFYSASGGTVGDALGALFNALDAGKAYFDIHTTMFPNGEIRGFLSRVLGDYNDNGIVDAADYVVWRKTLGTSGEGLKADSNNDNVINDDDYTAWRQNFGNFGLSSLPGGGSSLASSIPEPGAPSLVAMALLASNRRKRRT
jgi:hypothetical protein